MRVVGRGRHGDDGGVCGGGQWARLAPGTIPTHPTRRYLQTASYIFDKVLAANDAGDFFPLHGTCMGFQTISILAAKNESVLETYAYDSEGISWPLDFTADAPNTRLWSSLSPADMATLRTVDSTVNLHHDGVPPNVYEENARMVELLVMTSTNVDRVGKAFVSSWTGRSHPITAVQLCVGAAGGGGAAHRHGGSTPRAEFDGPATPRSHPEKVAGQFNPGLGIPHTADVISANRCVLPSH